MGTSPPLPPTLRPSLLTIVPKWMSISMRVGLLFLGGKPCGNEV